MSSDLTHVLLGIAAIVAVLLAGTWLLNRWAASLPPPAPWRNQR